MTAEKGPFSSRYGFDAKGARGTGFGDPRPTNDPAGDLDVVNRRYLWKYASNIKIVGTESNLPAVKDIESGAAYLIRSRQDGVEINRLAVWDKSGTVVPDQIKSLMFDISPAGIAMAAATEPNWEQTGILFGNGNGDGKAEFKLSFNNAGDSLVTEWTNRGSGYNVHDNFTFHSGAALGSFAIYVGEVQSEIVGKWRFVDLANHIKALEADADQVTDIKEGDFQSTIEKDRKEIKVLYGGKWITLFSESHIRKLINDQVIQVVATDADPSDDHKFYWIETSAAAGNQARLVYRDGGNLIDLHVPNAAMPVSLDTPVGTSEVVNTNYFWENSNYLKMVGRVGDLPDPSREQIVTGETYVVKMEFGGQEMTRMAVWDGSLSGSVKPARPPGTISHGTTNAVYRPTNAGELSDLLLKRTTNNLQAGDVIELTARFMAASGGNTLTGDPNEYYVPNSSQGSQPVVSQPLHGLILHPKSVIIWLGDTRLNGADVDDGWGVIDPPDPLDGRWLHPTTGAVFNHNGAPASPGTPGDWRYVDPQNFIREQIGEAPQATDQHEGDLDICLEANNEMVKVWHSGAWSTIYDWNKVLTAIASLSLFEGTVQEDGGTVIGSIQINGLPNLDNAASTALVGKIGHYWVWQGQAGYVIKGADPHGVGRDLNGLTLQPGDWLQIANTTGDPAHPNLTWQRIGGDLLSRNRWFGLGGLQNWRAGGWERDSLVVYDRKIWRANRDIIPSDSAPGLPQARIAEEIDIDFGSVTPGDVVTVTCTSGGNTTNATLTLNPGEAITAFNGRWRAELNNNTPNFQRDIGTAGLLMFAPDMIRITAATPGTPFTVAAQIQGGAALPVVTRTPNRVGGGASGWTALDLAGGLNFVMTDGDLPASGPVGQVYFVVSSARAGGIGALYYWDGGANQWQPLGGAGGTPLDLSAGDELINYGVPVGTILMWPNARPPRGYLLCDGSTYNITELNELHDVIRTPTVPDLRGQFIRGWSADATVDKGGPRTPLSTQADATALPKTPFKYTGDDGVVKEFTLSNTKAGWTSGHEIVSYEDSNDDKIYVPWAGADPETRPVNIAMVFIIKAFDATNFVRS